MPQTDLVRRQHWFSQITLQPIDDAKRTPIAARQHDRVGFRHVYTAADIVGGLRIEETDLEIADQSQRLLREDFDSVCCDERRDALVDRSAPRRAEYDLFDGKHMERFKQRGRGRGGRLAACRAYSLDEFLVVANAVARRRGGCRKNDHVNVDIGELLTLGLDFLDDPQRRLRIYVAQPHA